MHDARDTHRFILVFTGLAAAFLLPGCAGSPSRLNVDVETCCEANFHEYRTYTVEMSDVPGFLEPYLYGGLTTVLAQKGLEQTMGRPDLRVSLLFDQVFLTPESTEEDYFGEGVAPDIANRFMAAVSVDVIDADSDHLVWAGRLSRIHTDPHGRPRGNDHKMQGIIDGFAELFADYPSLSDDIPDMYPND